MPPQRTPLFWGPEIIPDTQRRTSYRDDTRVTTTNTHQRCETSQDTMSCQAEGLVSIDSQQRICTFRLSRQDGPRRDQTKSWTASSHIHSPIFVLKTNHTHTHTRGRLHIEEDQRLLGRKAKGNPLKSGAL